MCHQINSDDGQSFYLADPAAHAPEILHSLESFSLICIDDVQTLMSNDEWEEALFHLINAVRDQSNNLILSSNVPAAKLACQLPDLKTRMLAMVSVKSNSLSDHQKLDMLKQRANNRGFSLSDETARFILDRSPRDMVHLVRLLEKLEEETLRQQKLVTIPFVKKALNL